MPKQMMFNCLYLWSKNNMELLIHITLFTHFKQSCLQISRYIKEVKSENEYLKYQKRNTGITAFLLITGIPCVLFFSNALTFSQVILGPRQDFL